MVEFLYQLGESSDRPTELNSWKEISAYLNVTIRTAQRWELERGLPVQRLPGGRGRVYARVSDLEAWKTTAANLPEDQGRRWRVWVLAAGGLAVVLTAGYWIFRLNQSPASAKWDTKSLYVYDASGRELWRKTFEKGIRATPGYLTHPSELDGRVRICDLDRDGSPEVLFAYNPSNQDLSSGAVICYSARGKEKWQFSPSRAVATRHEAFDPIYMIRGFAAFPVSNGGPWKVAISISHTVYYPAAVVLLSERGELLREYWHAGHLLAVEALDLDADGKPEIFAGGISNSRERATLIVLDPETFGGVSDESANPDYQFLGMPPGNVRARLLFPRTRLNRALLRFNSVWGISRQPSGLLVQTQENSTDLLATVNFHLDKSLRLINLDLPDSYVNAVRILTSQGKIHIPVSAEQEEKELWDIQYLQR